MRFRVALVFLILVALSLSAYASAPELTAQEQNNYIAIAAGSEFAAALRQDGTVWAWGKGGNQGNGVALEHRFAPVPVWGLEGVTAIACGPYRTLAVKGDGTVWTWGYNPNGILGDGTTSHQYFPVQVVGLDNVLATAPGEQHSLALKRDGTVWAWGSNAQGQLGNGSYQSSSTPAQVPGLTDIIAVAAGSNHSAALKADGTVWIWGLQLGQTGNSTSPVQVTGIPQISAIAAGSSHMLLLSTTGTVYAWGSNGFGQLGNGSTTASPTPALISGLTNVERIAAGYNNSHAISGGDLWIWGSNSGGQTSIQYGPLATTQPTQVTTLTGITASASGSSFSLALVGNRAWAWGNNYYGQVGNLQGMHAANHIPSPVTDKVHVANQLREAIYDALGRYDITREDMALFTGFLFSGQSLYTLTGLEYAINLQILDISYTYVNAQDNFPLFAYTPELRYLDISGIDVTDLTPITWLRNLEVLGMAQTGLTDVQLLSQLTQLQILSLWDNNIGDIAPLANLKKLRYLDLDYCSVMDLAPLLGLPQLETVYLGNNPFPSAPFSANRAVMRALMHRGVMVNAGPMNIDTSRLSGSNRYGTAAAISSSGWNKANTVLLARGDNYADALAGVPLATLLEAPVLLTQPTVLTAETLAEIQRLEAKHVVILGGTGAVSAGIENQLTGLGLTSQRIAGANRFATAAEIAREMQRLGAPMEKAVVVYGLNFPDALAAAPYAAINGYPILLTGTHSLDPTTAAVLSQLGIQETIVAGGSGVISNSVMNSLPSPVRVAGNDRYGTAVALARHFVQDVDIARVFVATGTNFADAITGAALAAKMGHGMLLVHRVVPPSVDEYLGDYLPCGIIALGFRSCK